MSDVIWGLSGIADHPSAGHGRDEPVFGGPEGLLVLAVESRSKAKH
jgi:hypothetical protein